MFVQNVMTMQELAFEIFQCFRAASTAKNLTVHAFQLCKSKNILSLTQADFFFNFYVSNVFELDIHNMLKWLLLFFSGLFTSRALNGGRFA